MSVKKYLALDYGKSKIGVAIADSEIRIAFAYGTINNKDFIMSLGDIIRKENIDAIIIGELGNAGKGEKSFEAREIGERIEKELKKEVFYQEEMFSTKMAENNLKEKGVRGIKRLDNQEAARIILQSWLGG